MSRFSRFKKSEVDPDRVVKYVLVQLDGEPVLHLKPGTQANKKYFKALLNSAATQSRKSQATTMKTVEVNREEDRELYPGCVVVGWEKVLDDQGQAVEFSIEDCRDFLKALPDWVFDDVRNFAGNPANFVDIPEDYAEEALKN